VALAYQPRDETLGRYRLFARLGHGGMAELYVARLIGAAGVEKLVVIKRMLPHLAEDPQFVAMFENEGRIAARLNHPNVCQTYELDEADGQLFLVMEFLRGLPWSDVVTALPTDEQARCRFIAGVLVQACEGLHYAHDLVDVDGQVTPVVHRDVSPANLMITTDGVIKLLDFGVSKILTEGPSTRTGMIKGKLPYMAPEQIRGEVVDGRADIFSLGVVLWEALSGQRLFDRSSDFQIWKAVTEEPIPRLAATPITARLEVVVQRALARDRDHRQGSARMFADELREALAPYGAPMSQSEIRIAIAAWMQPSLSRESRDLAAAISQHREADVETATTKQLDISRTSVDLILGRAPITQVHDAAAAPPRAAFPSLAMWAELDHAIALDDPDDLVTEDDPGTSGRARLDAAVARSSPSAIKLREVSVIVTAPVTDDADEQPTVRAGPRAAVTAVAIAMPMPPDSPVEHGGDQVIAPHVRVAVETAVEPVVPSLVSTAHAAPSALESFMSIAPTGRRFAPVPGPSNAVVETAVANLPPPRRWLIPVLVLSAGAGIATAIAFSTGDPPALPPQPALAVDAVDSSIVDAGSPDASIGEQPTIPPPLDAGSAEPVEPEPPAPPAPGSNETRPSPRRPPPPKRETGTGFYFLDSRPYATIYIDNKKHGDTPLHRVALPAGPHTIRAVRSDGKRKTFTITIRAGAELNAGFLAW